MSRRSRRWWWRRTALLLGLPLLFSRDVYSYAFYGRIAGVYGGNPYVQTPLDHPTDALWKFVGPIWVNTPAVYGPVWSSLSGWLSTWLRARPEAHVEAYRMIALVASLATCAVIVWTVRRLWPERTAFALVAFGANPVVVFHAVASGHNDMLVALMIASAFALVVSHKEMPAIALLTIGALDQSDRGPAVVAAARVVHRAAQAGGSLARGHHACWPRRRDHCGVLRARSSSCRIRRSACSSWRDTKGGSLPPRWARAWSTC